MQTVISVTFKTVLMIFCLALLTQTKAVRPGRPSHAIFSRLT